MVNLAPIYSYSKSKGLFAGVSLEGSVILTRNDANAEMYGRKVTAKELLSGEIPPPVQAEALYRVLNYKFSNMGTGVAVPHPVTQRTLTRSGTASAPVSRMGTVNKVGMATSSSSMGNIKGAADGTGTPIKKAPPPPPPKPGAASKQQKAMALYDFLGERPSDLSFRKGEIIEIITAGGPSDWWVGRSNGKQGDFPGNYVEQL